MAGFGISNFEIEKVIENSHNDDLQKTLPAYFHGTKKTIS